MKDTIKIQDKEREVLIKEITKMKINNDEKNKSNAWTGDTNGHEFYLQMIYLKIYQ